MPTSSSSSITFTFAIATAIALSFYSVCLCLFKLTESRPFSFNVFTARRSLTHRKLSTLSFHCLVIVIPVRLLTVSTVWMLHNALDTFSALKYARKNRNARQTHRGNERTVYPFSCIRCHFLGVLAVFLITVVLFSSSCCIFALAVLGAGMP